MNINDQYDTPMTLKISFNKLLERYEALAQGEDEFAAAKARRILKTVSPYPELREGFEDTKLLDTYKDEIEVILQDSFSKVLTSNEIKTASVPFSDIIFNSSERFKNIIETAGHDFNLKIINMPEDDRYRIACIVILQFCYGYNFNFKRPFFYEIPDANGIKRFYKILYNADFTEIEITDKTPKITQEDYENLLDNFDDMELWKEKFPPNSYVFKGFVISNIFDVTDDQSISNIKSNLISEKKRKDENFMEDFQETFRSLMNIKDLRVGFSAYNGETESFERVYGDGVESYLLNEADNKDCKLALCGWSYSKLLKEKQFISVSDVDKHYKSSKDKAPHLKALKAQGIKSAIFAPIANDEELLAVLEIVSDKPKILNSINANKLIDVMPIILMAVERSRKEEGNLLEAVIQKECTSIHSSVRWRFEQAAKNFIREQQKGNDTPFNKIAFNDVYPLYGQIDISGSSIARNKTIQLDLNHQLKEARKIIKSVIKEEQLSIYEQIVFQIDTYLSRLKDHFQVDSEQQITAFLTDEIRPLFEHLLKAKMFVPQIENYFETIDDKLGVLYKHRKDYDDTVMIINRQMAEMLDTKQIEAQQMYPHYFERFKTDGVEHNMYIGESITREDSFNPIYLYNLRLWQLQVMCEMENEFYQNQHNLPIALDVASMILVFNQPLTISFRMDEKQFDVDGTYNARYEIVKKRVDKAYVKGTTDRLTQKGKISIVYSQKEDEREYMRYIKFLQSKNYLDTDMEIVELQDLQAVTGLKAIRVSVLYHKNKDDKAFFTYDDLMKELKA